MPCWTRTSNNTEKARRDDRSFLAFFVHMPAITAMMLCQLLLRAAGTVVRRRAGAEPEETVFMAVIGTDG